MAKSISQTLNILVVLVTLAACSTAAQNTPLDSSAADIPAQPTTTPKPQATATQIPLARPTANKYLLAYDPDLEKVLLIGAYVWNLDIWAYDVTNQALTRMKDKPPSTILGLDYNTEAGGIVAINQNTTVTWLYDPQQETWTKLEPSPDSTISFDVGSQCSFVYDTESTSQVILIWKEGLPATMVFDYATNTWKDEHLDPSPYARECNSRAYDVESDRILQWEAGTEKQMWAYDANTSTWEKLIYSGGPSKFGSCWASVYVPELDRMFTYYLDEFYAYDYNSNTWEQAKGELHPGARMNHSLAYDPTARKIVMYGGDDENGTTHYDDLWLYDPWSGEWTKQELP